MPACQVGCCPDDNCDCSTDCECLLPAESDFSGRLGFENPSLFADNDLKKNDRKSPFKICPCKNKDEISKCAKLLEDGRCGENNKQDTSKTEYNANNVSHLNGEDANEKEHHGKGHDSLEDHTGKADTEEKDFEKKCMNGGHEGQCHETCLDSIKETDTHASTCGKDKDCKKKGRNAVAKKRSNAGIVNSGCCSDKDCGNTCGRGDSTLKVVSRKPKEPVHIAKKPTVHARFMRKSFSESNVVFKASVPRRMSERRPSCFQAEARNRHNADPHHGHQHHHYHEFHHKGGHHHHMKHPHGDGHHHDDNDHHHHGSHNHDDGHYHDKQHHHHGDGHGDDHHHDKHHHHGDGLGHDHHHENGHHHDSDHHHDKHHHHGDGHDHDHDDGHGRDHHHKNGQRHGNDNCCGNDHHGDSHDDASSNCSSLSCAESACNRKSCCDEPDCDARDASSSSHEELRPLVQPVKVNIDVGELRVQTTKLRVQNMCCPKESRIVHEELRKLEGIKNVRVNVIGRVVHVSHQPDVVSPTELMNTLNGRHLGVSIVDTGSEEEDGNSLPKTLKIILGNLAVQTVLFGIALGGKFSDESWYMWVAIAVICFGVIPVLKKSFYAIRNLEIDLNILITITVIGTLAIQEWIEGAAVIFVFTLAGFLQQFCFHRVQKTISSLMLSKPSKAVMACTGECLPIEEVPIGSIIAVRQGELIPLDGIVVKGSASVDESSISGEAAPIEKVLDSETFSGTVIQHGYLEIETTSSSTSSTISKISSMVEDAQMNVSPTEIMVNKFAKLYTPLVVLVAALVFLLPLFLGLSGVDAYEGKTKTWGERALIVLVTACPCALLMATPTVVICGINGAARLGALIKGGTFLEALAQLNFLAFDKTGTLTEGKFQVVDLLPVEKADESEVLRWAAALESKSSHPLAAAVVSEFTGECISDFVADAEELLLPEVKNFSTMEGQGISGKVEGHSVEVGNHSMLKKLGIKLSPKFEAAYLTYCSDSKTVVFVCVDGKLALMISLADIIRWESRAALTWLQDLGVHLAMLTGDSKQTATAVQKELMIDTCISEMKPDDKLNWISEIREEELHSRLSCITGKHTRVVGMVGDGVNDGPALAAANCGIAMAAGGSALAVEAAGVALMTNSVLKVPEMICLSRFCRRIILQNIILAVLLKLVFVVVALTGFVRVWMAVLADLVGLVAVILNGLRPLRWEPPKRRIKKVLVPRASWRRKRPVLQYETVV